MSTHIILLSYRTPKRYPTIISIMPPGMALIVTLRGLNYCCLEQIFMVPKGLEPLKFDYIYIYEGKINQSTDSTGGSIVSECRLGK